MIVNLAVISHTISSSSNVTTLSSSTQHGLVAIGSLAALSIVTTGILLLILTFRFVFNVRYHVQQASSTMHHVLIYNLVLAQLLQSLNFVIALRWSVLDVVVASSGWCSTQAGLLQVGDVAAGAFALVIAVQSLWSTVKAQKSNRGCLVAAVVGIWVVAVVLSVCARAGRRRDFFVPNAGSWCEIAREYGPDRLWRYYFWLFVDVFGIIAIYCGLAVYLISKSRFLGTHASCRSEVHNSHLHGAGRTMLLYPLIYVVLSLPLTIIRLISTTSTSTTPSTTSHFVAAAFASSSGWLTVLVYALSHRNLTASSSHTRSRSVRSRNISQPIPLTRESTPPHLGNTTVITGKGALDFRYSVNSHGQNVSASSIKDDGFEAALEEGLAAGAVAKKTTVSVFCTPAPPANTPMEGSVCGGRESTEVWHTWA